MTEIKAFTRDEIAAIFGVTPRTVTRWVQLGQFERPCTPPGKRPRWKKSAIDNYLNANPLTKKEQQIMKSLSRRA